VSCQQEQQPIERAFRPVLALAPLSLATRPPNHHATY
jgi:hypothetical protein